MAEVPPEPKEVTEYLYKLQGRLKVFSAQSQTPNNAASMVATASKHGLLFVATPTGFQVLMTSTLTALPLSQREDVSSYPRRDITLNTWPTHIAVNCDQTRLAVVVVLDSCPFAVSYDIASFTSRNVNPLQTARLCATSGTTVNDLAWNPAIPYTLAACLSDGSVIVYDFGANSLNSLPATSKSTCLCWSPKGKQIVIGCEAGTISQYKPELTLVKTLPQPPAPPNIQGAASVISVYWVSNYQFAAVYSFSGQAALMVVNALKGAPVKYINYDDICYSGGTVRNPQFYLYLQTTWNVLIVASANSIEVGTLGSVDQTNWVQWTQEDSARAELPLTSDHQETYPLGIAFDTSNTRQYPWGENQFLPPPPLLALLSNDGLLCLFNVINLLPGAASLCAPPAPLPDMSGLDEFKVPAPQATAPPPPPEQQVQQPVVPQPQQQVAPQPAQSFFQQTQAPKPAAASGQSLFQPSAPAFQPAAAATKTVQWTLDETKTLPSTPPSFAPQATSGVMGWGQSSTPTKVESPTAFGSGGGLSLGSSSSGTPTVVASPVSSSPAHQSSPLTIPPKPLPSLVPVPPAKDEPLKPAAVPPKPDQSKQPESAGKGDSPAAIDPTVYIELISEEITTFYADLEKQKRSDADFKKVGTQEERKRLCTGVADLEEFLEARLEHVSNFKSEVFHLKAVAFEALRWMEDAKSRVRKHSDPSYLHLMKSSELDSTTARHADNITYLLRYVESQIRDADNQLGAQWGEFQDSVKARSNKMQVPMMEGVYQTLVRQKNILNKLRCVLEDVENRLRQRRRRQNSRNQLINNAALNRVTNGTGDGSDKSTSDLSKLAENLLHMKLNQSIQDMNEFYASSNNGVGSSDVDRLTNIKLSKVKESKLRKILEQQPMVRVKPDRTYADMQVAGMRASCSFGSTVLHLPGVRSKNESNLAKSLRNKLKLASEKKPEEEKDKTSAPLTSSAPIPAKTGFSLPAETTVVPQVTKEPAKSVEAVAKQATAPATKPALSFPVQPEQSAFKLNTEKKDNGLLSLLGKPAEDKPKPPLSSATVGSSEPVSFFNQKSSPSNIFGGGPATTTVGKVTSTSPNQTVAPKPPTQNLFGGAPFSGSPITALKPFQTSAPSKTETSSLLGTPFSQTATPTTKDESSKPPGSPFGTPKSDANTSSLLSEGTSVFGGATAAPFFGGLSKPSMGLFQSPPPAEKPDSTGPPKSPVDSLGSLVASLDSTVGKPAPAAEKLTPAVSIFPVSSGAMTSAASSFSFALQPSTASITTVTTSTVPSGPIIVVNPSATGPLNLSATPTGTSIFGGATITPVEPKTPESVPAVATTTPSSSAVSITAMPLADSTTSMFSDFGLGSAPTSTATTKPANIFGGATEFQVGKPFGTSSLFGGAAVSEATSSASQSIFGGSTTTDSQSKSIFGTPNTSTASNFSFSPLFGGTPASSAQTTSAPATSAQPIFGTASLASSTATTTSTFAPAAPSTASPFGSSASTGSIFGQPASTSAFGGSSFSFATSQAQSQAPKTGADASFTFSLSTLSSPAPAATTQSVFGGKPATPFGTTPPATTSQTSFMGQTVCSPSAFGSGASSPSAGTSNNVFGGAKPVFGQAASPTLFGGSPTPAFGQPAFSQSPASGFGTNGGSIFGGSSTSTANSVFGGPSSGNLFQSTANTTSNSIFGGSPSGGGAFSSGVGVAQTGFGAPSSPPRTASGFGAAPSFGSPAASTGFGGSPAFGSTPAFGSPPAFGGAPAFSSPSRVFGQSPSAAPAFGATTPQQNSTFETLATQDAGMTFGNLAQATTQQSTNLFNAAASSPPFSSANSSFGGSSFSSWR